MNHDFLKKSPVYDVYLYLIISVQCVRDFIDRLRSGPAGMMGFFEEAAPASAVAGAATRTFLSTGLGFGNRAVFIFSAGHKQRRKR
jgi:hypothetical protein